MIVSNTVTYASIIVCILAVLSSIKNIRTFKNSFIVWFACIFNFSSILPVLVLSIIILYGGSSAFNTQEPSLLLENAGRIWITLWPLGYIGLPVVAIVFVVIFLKYVSEYIKQNLFKEKIDVLVNLLITSINSMILLYLTYFVVPDA